MALDNNEKYIEILTSIISVVVGQIKGVASINLEPGTVFTKIKKNNSHKSINVTISNNYVVIDIFVNVLFGFNVPKLSSEIQQKLKEEIENTTKFKVKKTNVNVVGVVF